MISLIKPSLFFLFLNFLFFSLSAQSNFNYGVASGDATDSSVVIWSHYFSTQDTLQIQYQVALNQDFNQVLSQGYFYTNLERDHTIKVDVNNLPAGKQLFYRFIFQNDTSEIGISYTTPKENISNYQIGVVSCANFEAGYFNGYEVLANIDNLKLVIHLGDYIYEYGSKEYGYNKTSKRIFSPQNELITLTDYRSRYKQYRTDASLKKLHQKVPFYCLWDDHEFADDAHSEGADNHNMFEGNWQSRKAAAMKAYFEWMPVRENAANNISRAIKIGNLANILLVDTRMGGREPGKKMLGNEQNIWLTNSLLNSNCKWNIMAQQVMMSPLKLGKIKMNADQWDGFENDRVALLKFIQEQQIQNFVVLSGDFHSSWASELKYKNETVGREIVSPGITSGAFEFPFLKSIIYATNPHIKYTNLKNQGFVSILLSQEFLKVDFNFLQTIDYFSDKVFETKSFYLLNGKQSFDKGLNKPLELVLKQD